MPADVVNVSRAERLFALRACSAFDGLTTTELWRVGASLRPRQCAAGESVTLPGMPLAALEFVVSGRVEVDDPSGRQVRGPRDVIGDLVDLLDEAPAPHAVAIEPTLTLEFDRAALEDLLEDDFSIFLGVLRATARRLARGAGQSSNGRSQRPERGSRKSRRSLLDLVERVLLLQKEAHFRRCEIAPLATLAEGATEFVLGPGEAIFPAGATTDFFVLLVSGRAVVRTPSGSYRVGAGDELGMCEALAGEMHWSSATAGTTLRGLRVATSSLIDVIEDYPSFGLGLLRSLAHEVEENASPTVSAPHEPSF